VATWVLLAVCCAATSTLSGAFGMAGGMVLLAVLSAILPVGPALAVHGLVQAASNGSRWWLLRRHVALRSCALYAAGAVVAAALAASAAWRPDRATVHVALGAVALAAVALRGRVRLRFDDPRGAAGCGAAVSVTQLTAGVSGPLLDAFFVDSPLDRRAVVGTKACTQTLAHVLKTAYFALLAGGLAAGAAPPLSAVALCGAAAVVGTHVGTRFLERLDESRFRRWTTALVVVLGAGHLVAGVVLAARGG
jgi:uncharacterized membrane protein YfcA